MKSPECKRIITYFQKQIYYLVLLLLAGNTYAQVEYPGHPLGPGMYQKYKMPFIKIDRPVSQDNADKSTDYNFKIDFFAYTVPVSINPMDEGILIKDVSGINICLLGIVSVGASSLGLTFDPFDIRPGTKIFIYTPKGTEVMGAFTFRNMNATGLLTTGSLKGDSIIIEIQTIPDNTDLCNLRISTVSIGYEENLQKSADDEWFGRSASCHVDINCIQGQAVQQQKYSVCRLIIERGDGRVRCSGTLLNNTGENGMPLILTAGHCITNMYAAHRTVVYFNYESPYCNGPDGEIKSVSGSFLRSRGDSLDFALIELAEKPPIDYYPLYSGWDATDSLFTGSYCIHHPEGDVKKYAGDSDLIMEGPYMSIENSQWVISRYENGTTEDGSSGSALYNSKNRVVGTLSGGGEVCTEYIYDYYQKISTAWERNPEEDKQLKAWLDPENTGALSLDNLDPAQGITEKLSNIGENDVLSLVSADDWGYISGHNSLSSVSFAEHFYRNGSKYIYGINLDVAKATPAFFDSNITLFVWEGDDKPGRIVYEKPVYLFELEPESENFIRLDTLILVDRDFFVGCSVSYPEPADTFALYTRLYPEDDNNTAFMNRGSSWERLNDGQRAYNASLSISPMVLDYYPPPEFEYGTYPFNDIIIYPNPTSDILQILFRNKPEGIVHLAVYDVLGKLVLRSEITDPEPNFQFSAAEFLPAGMYFLRIEINSSDAIMKFIKLQ